MKQNFEMFRNTLSFHLTEIRVELEERAQPQALAGGVARPEGRIRGVESSPFRRDNGLSQFVYCTVTRTRWLPPITLTVVI
jgi:hypothetical protein